MATLLDEKKPATSRLASPSNIFPGNRLQGDSGSSGAPVGATPTPPPAAAPAVARLAGPSELYMQDRAKEMSDQWGSGNYAQATGTAARTAVQGLGMYGIELADKVATPAIGAAGKFASGLFGSEANAAQPASSSTATPAATVKVAAPVTVASAAIPPSMKPGLTYQLGTMPAATVQAAPAVTTAALPDGVYQHGRGQYSDQAGGMGWAPNFTGKPSTVIDALAGALDRRSQLARMGGNTYVPESSGLSTAPGSSAAISAFPSSGAAAAVASGSANQPSAQNQRAASSLAAMSSPMLAELQGGVPSFTAPAVAHSGNDWGARQRLKDMETSASSITNRPEWRSGSSSSVWGSRHNQGVNDPDGKIGRFNTATQADLVAQGKASDLQQKTNEINAGLQRGSMAEAGADRRAQGQLSLGMGQLALGAQRNSIDTQRASSDERLRAPQIRTAERLGQMQEAFVNAETPEQKAAIASQMRAYGGKDDADWKVQVTPATKNVDGSTTAGSVIRYNSRSGDVQDVSGVGGKPSAPAKDSLKAGQIYQTPRGQARWNGAEFELVG